MAAAGTQACDYSDWWWKLQLGKCYYKLGLYRDAEQQFKSAVKLQPVISSYLHLGRVYARMDQPMSSIDVYKQGLEIFPGEVSLQAAMAR